MTNRFLKNIKGMLAPKPNADDRFINFDGSSCNSKGIWRIMQQPNVIASAIAISTLSAFIATSPKHDLFVAVVALMSGGFALGNVMGNIIEKKVLRITDEDTIDKQGRMMDWRKTEALRKKHELAFFLMGSPCVPLLVAAKTHALDKAPFTLVTFCGATVLGLAMKGVWHYHADSKIKKKKWTAGINPAPKRKTASAKDLARDALTP